MQIQKNKNKNTGFFSFDFISININSARASYKKFYTLPNENKHIKPESLMVSNYRYVTILILGFVIFP